MKSYIYTSGNKDYYIDIGEEFTEKNKTRAFVNYDAPENHLDAIKQRAEDLGLENIYTSPGQYPEMDKLWDQQNRRIVSAKRKILQDGLAAAGLGSPELKWSRKAGCSCGCSPGFILTNPSNTSIDVRSYDELVESTIKTRETCVAANLELMEYMKTLPDRSIEQIPVELLDQITEMTHALSKLKHRARVRDKALAEMIDTRVAQDVG